MRAHVLAWLVIVWPMVVWPVLARPRDGLAAARDQPSEPRNPRTTAEERGRAIYFGTARDQPPVITASIGDPPTEVAASMMACARCHGSDGRGSREGAVVASDITWDALTKPYGVTHASGRTHRPYTERLLVRAIGLGFDPDGHRLHAAMPRFQMSHADAAALVAWLKQLGRDNASGVTDASIRLATVTPADGPLAEPGRAAVAALRAYFDTINAQGGVYGRRLELHVATLGRTDSVRRSIDTSLRDTAPLAIVGGRLSPGDRDVIAAIETRGIPFVGPLTTSPDPSAIARTTFYLLSGVEQQARALADFALTRSKTDPAPALTIVHSSPTVSREIVERISAECTRSGWRISLVDAGADGVTGRDVAGNLTRQASARALLLVDGRAMQQLLAEFAAADGLPTLLVPGALATNDLLRATPVVLAHTFIALPSLPSDQTSAGLEEYRRLAKEHGLPSTETGWQLAALSSGKVLVEALKIAGRGVDRQKLVAALEALSDFDSGLTPRLRFSRSQRIGAAGAYIVTLDPQDGGIRPLSGWIAVN